MVLYLAIVSILGLFDYSSMKQYIQLGKTQNYANIFVHGLGVMKKMMISSMRLLFQS